MKTTKKLQRSDYFNLDWVKAEIERLTICSLELSKIVRKIKQQSIISKKNNVAN